MSYVRIQIILLSSFVVCAPAQAAIGTDLDPRVLLAPAPDASGHCKTDPNACCGTSFQSVTGSISSKGARNLCFGSQSISALTSAAPSQSVAQQGVSSAPMAAGSVGGGGGGASASPALSSFFSSGGDPSAPTSPGFFGGGGGGGGGQNAGAPGPMAGAGLPFLLLAGAYAWFSRRNARA